MDHAARIEAQLRMYEDENENNQDGDDSEGGSE